MPRGLDCASEKLLIENNKKVKKRKYTGAMPFLKKTLSNLTIGIRKYISQ